MHAIVDYREQPSGIIELMRGADIDVEVKKVACGDIIIDGIVTVERKTATDFVVSITDGRLFRQAANLKRNCDHPVFIIEGNPLQTGLEINRVAVRGAILNIQTVWNIPVVHSQSTVDSIEVMQVMAHQFEKMSNLMTPRAGYRPRRLSTRQLYVLQGFPGVGPHVAKRLLNHFGSVSAALAASVETLKSARGVGRVTAESIRAVLDAKWVNFRVEESHGSGFSDTKI
ncbi:MAG: ERCC4 domain-containing protein [Desulfobacterales bacterium]